MFSVGGSTYYVGESAITAGGSPNTAGGFSIRTFPKISTYWPRSGLVSTRQMI